MDCLPVRLLDAEGGSLVVPPSRTRRSPPLRGSREDVLGGGEVKFASRFFFWCWFEWTFAIVGHFKLLLCVRFMAKEIILQHDRHFRKQFKISYVNKL